MVKIENAHVWVFGSNTGIPVEQVNVTSPPAAGAFGIEKSIIAEASARDAGPSEDVPQIDVLCAAIGLRSPPMSMRRAYKR